MPLSFYDIFSYRDEAHGIKTIVSCLILLPAPNLIHLRPFQIYSKIRLRNPDLICLPLHQSFLSHSSQFRVSEICTLQNNTHIVRKVQSDLLLCVYSHCFYLHYFIHLDEVDNAAPWSMVYHFKFHTRLFSDRFKFYPS